jgi:hypothetical protein
MRLLLKSVVLIFILLAIPSAARANVLLSFNPNSQTVPLPDTAAVDLIVSGLGGGSSPALGGFEFNILYDSSIVAATDVSFGLNLGDPNAGQAIAIADTSVTGVLSIAEVSLLSPSDLVMKQPSSFAMATIEFQSISGGTTLLDYDSVVLSDEIGNILPFSAGAGSITVASIPEPSSIVLLTLLLAPIALRLIPRRIYRGTLSDK